MKKSALILLMKRVEKKETSTKLCWLHSALTSAA